MARNEYGETVGGRHPNQAIGKFYDASTDIFAKMLGANVAGGIHAGIWDDPKRSRGIRSLLPGNLLHAIQRQNEVPSEWAAIQPGETVLDAGSGVGGTSLHAAEIGARVIGATLSPRQARLSTESEKNRRSAGEVTPDSGSASFAVMDFTRTGLQGESIDVVIGNETFCYAGVDRGAEFANELYRILAPGGRVISLDGWVNKPEDNEHWIIKRHRKGWLLPRMSTMQQFADRLRESGFDNVETRDITPLVEPTIRLLGLMYLGGSAVMTARRLMGIRNAELDPAIEANLVALRGQWLAHKLNLGHYGVVLAHKPIDGDSPPKGSLAPIDALLARKEAASPGNMRGLLLTSLAVGAGAMIWRRMRHK